MKKSELDALLSSVLKHSAKGRGWKFSRGFVFRATDRLFFELLVSAAPKDQRIDYRLGYKMLAFDDVFWRIVKTDGNVRQPLSFRAAGAWTVPSTWVSIGSESVGQWDVRHVGEAVGELFVTCESVADAISAEVTDFETNLRVIERAHSRLRADYPGAVLNTWLEQLLTAILTRDDARSTQIVRDRIANRDSGGFQVGRQSFYDLAADFIDSERRSPA